MILEPALAPQTRATPFLPLTPKANHSAVNSLQRTSPKLGSFDSYQKIARLTACHVLTSYALNWVSRLGIDVAHTDAGAVSLVDIIDEKVGEASVSVDDLSGCYCQQYALDIGKMHDLVRVLLR